MGDMTLPTDECYKVNPEEQDGGAQLPPHPLPVSAQH
jgi:hypothetical protein